MSVSSRYLLVPLASLTLFVGTLAAQGSRDLTTPAKRLVGHWALIPGESTDVYFGPTDSAGKGPVVQVSHQAGGATRRRQYAVERQAAGGDELALSIISESGEARRGADRVVLSKDGQSLTWTTAYETPIRVRAVMRLVYIDASAPPQH
jgi:hypothetical protein